MAVLIKDMEMPSGCQMCRFMTNCSGCEGWSDSCILLEDDPTFLEWEDQPETRPDYCPLVEVKTGPKQDTDILEEAGFEI